MLSVQESKILTFAAVADLSEKTIVTTDGVVSANDGDGIAKFTVKTGDTLSLITYGVTIVKAGDAFSKNALLTADSNGKAVAVNPADVAIGSSVKVIGKALMAATEEDDEVLILLNQQIIVGTKTT